MTDDAPIHEEPTREDPIQAARREARAAAPASSPAAPGGEQAGDEIGRYKLLERIGEGGMGTVWMAEQHEPVRRKVALKIIKLGMDTREVVVRFEAERQALALMDHPSIAKVLDGGATDGGRPYFVMELVKGVPITDYCDAAKLGLRERLELFTKVCEAVQHAHHKGVIHRDVKPSNVMVTLHDGEPVPKVIDFGIAKATSAELTQKTMFTRYAQLIGTPEYMAPEQAAMSGVDIDTRADVYSLGVLLYELLTGTRPFELKTALEEGFEKLLQTIREVDPPKPSTRVSTLGEAATPIAAMRAVNVEALGRRLRGDLDWIVMKALEKERDRRYESPSALAADIGRSLRSLPVLAAPPSSLYRLRRFVRRRRKTVASLLAFAAILVAGFVGTTWGLWTALEQKERAEKAEQATALELARATEVKAVIKDMISGISPEEALGADTTLLRRLVERTAARLERGEVTDDRIAAELHGLIADAYLLVGDYDEAAEHAQRAIGASAGAHADRVRLARVWHRRGEHGRARELVEELLSSDATPEAAIFLRFLYGEILSAQMEFDEADAIAREVWEDARRELGEEHPTTRAAQTLLAYTSGWLGRREETLALSRDLYEAARRRDGEDHPDTLRCLTNLAVACWRFGDEEQALRLARASLAKMEAVFPDDHRDILTTEQALAMTLMARGELEEAAVSFERVLEGARRTLAPEHFLVLELQFGLSDLRSRQGRIAEAAQLADAALVAGAAVLEEDSVRAIGVLEMGAKAMLAAERYEKARELARRLLDWRVRVLGAEHPLTLDAKARLARAEAGCGDRDEAERLVDELWAKAPSTEVGLQLVEALEGDPARARAMIEEMLGRGERTVALLGTQYGLEFLGGEFERAAATAARWIEACERELGPASEVTLRARLGRAEALVRAGGGAEAIPIYREELPHLVEVLGPEHRNVVVAKMGLGQALAQTGELDAGVEQLLEARELAKRATAERLKLEFEATRRLAEVHFEAQDWPRADVEFGAAIELFVKLRGIEPVQEVQRAGSVAMSMNDLPKAERRFRRAVELSAPTEDLGVRARFALGLVHYRTDRLAEAVPWLEEAREAARTALPETDIVRTNACDVLGYVYQRQRRFPEALDAWQEAAELSASSMGSSNLSAATIRINVGHMHANLGQNEEAMESWERALVMMEAADIPDPQSASARERMRLQVYDRGGMTCWQLEAWERSAELLAAALEMKLELLGETHRETLGAMTNLGIALREAGEPDEAIAVLERSVAGKRKALSTNDPWFLNALATLVGAYDDAGEVEQGAPAAKELLALLERLPEGPMKWFMGADLCLHEQLPETYDPERALAWAEKAAERDDSWETLELLARAQYASGDEAAGRRTLDEAIAKAPPVSHERLRKIGAR